ncbi:putative klebicin D activity domain protein [Serratia plymuthica A30]|nr:putative klebicin D activity domain protein [Serratia plymuthica A30]
MKPIANAPSTDPAATAVPARMLPTSAAARHSAPDTQPASSLDVVITPCATVDACSIAGARLSAIVPAAASAAVATFAFSGV